MKFYVIEIPSKVAEVYELIATELDTPIQKVISDAVQLYVKSLTLEAFENVDEVDDL